MDRETGAVQGVARRRESGCVGISGLDLEAVGGGWFLAFELGGKANGVGVRIG